MVADSAHVAQSAERVLGKDEVSGSIPDMGSRIDRRAWEADEPAARTTRIGELQDGEHTLNVIATANRRV